MLKITAAELTDYNNVKEFYYTMIDELENAKYSPDWKKDIYPTQEYLLGAIENRELYIGETDGKIVSCMVVNHEYSEGYQNIKWSVEAADSELLIIHLLGVLPMYSGKGFARQMIGKVIELAHENNIKTIRLDVIEANAPAALAYTKIGFEYLETVKLYYEDTGWANFKLFEYII